MADGSDAIQPNDQLVMPDGLWGSPLFSTPGSDPGHPVHQASILTIRPPSYLKAKCIFSLCHSCVILAWLQIMRSKNGKTLKMAKPSRT